VITRVVDELQDLARSINESHQQCEHSLKTGMEHALKAGRLLLEAKEKVEHGQWLAWLEANCEVSDRLAQKYMRVARELPKLGEANTPRVADLSFRQAIDLVLKNGRGLRQIPAESRDHALELLEQDNHANVYRVKAELVREAKREELHRFAPAEGKRVEWPLKIESNWAAQNLERLKSEARSSPKFALRAEEIREMELLEQDIGRQIKDLYRKQQTLINQRFEKISELDRDVIRTIENEHGPIVVSTLQDTVIIRDPGLLSELETLREEGALEDLHELLLKSAGRCVTCAAKIRSLDDDYIMCHWCREHRGKTHCNACGTKLSEAEAGECSPCKHKSKLVEERVTQEDLDEFLAFIEGQDHGNGSTERATAVIQ
jgi:hypothetical protein